MIRGERKKKESGDQQQRQAQKQVQWAIARRRQDDSDWFHEGAQPCAELASMVPFESDYGEKIPRAIPIIYVAGRDSLQNQMGGTLLSTPGGWICADSSAGLLTKEKRSLGG